MIGQPIAAVLCAALATPVPIAAAAPAPEAAARQAAELTHARRYAEAAEAYARAFEETGEAVHLYSQAMSLRRAGSCPEAIGVFETFIAQDPPASDVEAARAQVAECEALIARAEPTPVAAPEPEPPPPVITQGEVEPEDSPPRVPWARDPWGGVLVAMGGVATVTGGGLLLLSNSASNGPDGETERAHARRADDVRNTSTAGFVLVGAGAALLIGGIIRYSVVARRDPAPRARDTGLTWRF